MEPNEDGRPHGDTPQQDLEIVCIDCGNSFVFRIAQQTSSKASMRRSPGFCFCFFNSASCICVSAISFLAASSRAPVTSSSAMVPTCSSADSTPPPIEVKPAGVTCASRANRSYGIGHPWRRAPSMSAR